MEMNRNEAFTFSSTNSVIVSEIKNTLCYRSSLILINTSTGGESITISVGQPVIASGSGVLIQPGGYWQDSEESKYLPTQEIVYVKPSVATATLSIQERVRSR